MKSLCVRVKSEALATASPRDTTRYDTICKPSLLLRRSGSPARQERPAQPYSWKSTRCSRSRKARTSRAKVGHGKGEKGEGEDAGSAEKRTLGKAGAAVKQDTWSQTVARGRLKTRGTLGGSFGAVWRRGTDTGITCGCAAPYKRTDTFLQRQTYISWPRFLFSFNSNSRCRGAKAAMCGARSLRYLCHSQVLRLAQLLKGSATGTSQW